MSSIEDALKRWKAPGYASLPACLASASGPSTKSRTLEAMRTQALSRGG
jgi:hypothetical protein